MLVGGRWKLAERERLKKKREWWLIGPSYKKVREVRTQIQVEGYLILVSREERYIRAFIQTQVLSIN